MLVQKIKFRIKQAVQSVVPPFYRSYSYAQSGEDVVLDFLLQQIGLTRPRYLEIGVFKPIEGSNTYKFYERGARGVLVEADETLLPWIRFTRPKDKLIHCGISTESQSEADFYIFSSRGINTFSKQAAEERQKSGQYKLVKTSRVPLKTINQIIEENFEQYPDFLSLDIEGLDLEVLRTLDFARFPVPILCVETCSYSENHVRPKDPAVAEFLHRQGYMTYADTYVNTIFVKSDWYHSM